jgi:Domain of unknown function (DUF3806)
MPLSTMRNFHLKILSCITVAFSGCQDRGTQTTTQVYTTPKDAVSAKETTSPTTGNYHIHDLTPELKHYLADRLQDARHMLQKYHQGANDSSYDAKTLDEVLDNWRLRKGEKEKPEFVVEALGFAFGQGLVDSLQMEWQTWSDAQGEDLTVINKKYMINAFPLSSAEKAYTENKVGSFESIRAILIKELKEAERSGQVKERK